MPQGREASGKEYLQLPMGKAPFYICILFLEKCIYPLPIKKAPHSAPKGGGSSPCLHLLPFHTSLCAFPEGPPCKPADVGEMPRWDELDICSAAASDEHNVLMGGCG